MIRLIMWLAFFAASTFLWVVLLEHGPEGFSDGLEEEWQALRDWLSRR